MTTNHTALPFMPVAFGALAALLWGGWWIPIRILDDAGISGPWAGLVMNVGLVLVVGLWLIARGTGPELNRRGILGAALVGVAVTTYSTALTYSDVVRVVLLFYLSPVWGKMIEWAFLRTPWRWTSTVALGAALLGAWFVLGGDVAPGSLNFGDILALISGMAWAAGAALIFTGGAGGASLTLVTAIFSVLVALPFVAVVGWPAEPSTWGVSMGLGFGAAYVLPLMLLTLWVAQKLAPATVTLLFTMEIISGVGSSALLLDEPFGWMQVIGAALIILAATVEILLGARSSNGA